MTIKAQDIIDQAYSGIVGIDDDLKVYGGYDEAFEEAWGEKPDYTDSNDWQSMPKEEKIILADRMIGLWQKYKEKAESQ